MRLSEILGASLHRPAMAGRLGDGAKGGAGCVEGIRLSRAHIFAINV